MAQQQKKEKTVTEKVLGLAKALLAKQHGIEESSVGNNTEVLNYFNIAVMVENQLGIKIPTTIKFEQRLTWQVFVAIIGRMNLDKKPNPKPPAQ